MGSFNMHEQQISGLDFVKYRVYQHKSFILTINWRNQGYVQIQTLEITESNTVGQGKIIPT